MTEAKPHSNKNGHDVLPKRVEIQWYTSLLGGGRKPPGITTQSGYITSYQPFADEIDHATDALIRFFDGNKKRPYVGMVFGPPGSGKSSLAAKLAESLKVKFVEINLSQFQEPRELLRTLRDRLNVDRSKKLVLLDEFDVTAGQSSAVRYLIGPLWDKQIEVDFSNTKFDDTGFILAGSYLSDVHTFEHLSQAFEEINLPLLLGDLAVHYQDERAVEFATNLLNGRSQIEINDSGSLAARLAHLTTLEKLPDLLSRVNGFKIELLNLSDPLSVTPWAPFRLCFCQPNIPFNLVSHNETLRIQKLNDPREYFVQFDKHPKIESGKKLLFVQPLECYKHATLAERLLRACEQVERQMRMEVTSLEAGLIHFLSVAPLRYGMRSLELLVDAIEWNNEPVVSGFDQDKLQDISGHILWDLSEMTIDRVWAESIYSSPEAGWPNQSDKIKLEKPKK